MPLKTAILNYSIMSNTNVKREKNKALTNYLSWEEILVEIRAIKGLRDRSVYITGSLASRIHLLQNTIIADTHKSRKYVDEMLVRTFLDLNDQQFPEEPKRKEYVNSIIYMTGSLL